MSLLRSIKPEQSNYTGTLLVLDHWGWHTIVTHSQILYHSWYEMWILASHLGCRIQPSHYIQHTIWKILLHWNALWPQCSQRYLSMEVRWSIFWPSRNKRNSRWHVHLGKTEEEHDRNLTDASGYGLVSAILQNEKPVVYASKALRQFEQGYVVLECKALAVTWALGKHPHFLYGHHFTLETDQKCLETIFNRSLVKSDPQL